MTGFGRSKAESEAFSVTVEVKTVNHRFCEFHIRMPRQLMKIEEKLKKKLGEHIQRGRIEVFVTIGGEAAVQRKIHIDWELLKEYYQNITKIKEKFGVAEEITIHNLLNRPELFAIEEEEVGNEELEALVLTAISNASEQLKQMRIHEGMALEKDLNAQLLELKQRILAIKDVAPTVTRAYETRIKKRVQEFLSGQVDENRILTEVAIFADRADINEELIRLESHIKQFEKTLLLLEPIGRKLDFLLQEMNREVNTIGSKANDSSIAKEVVEMKSLLEKMKEQVQNIE